MSETRHIPTAEQTAAEPAGARTGEDTMTEPRAFVVTRNTKAFHAGTIVYECTVNPKPCRDDQVSVMASPGQCAQTPMFRATLEQIPTCGQRTTAVSGDLSAPCACERDHPSRSHRTTHGYQWEDRCGSCHSAVWFRTTVRTPEAGRYAGIAFCDDCVRRCADADGSHACFVCEGGHPARLRALSRPVGWRQVAPITSKQFEAADTTVPDLTWHVLYSANYQHFHSNHDDWWKLSVNATLAYPGLELGAWSAGIEDRAHIPLRIDGEYVLPARAGNEIADEAVENFVRTHLLPALANKVRRQLRGGSGQAAEEALTLTADRFRELRSAI